MSILSIVFGIVCVVGLALFVFSLPASDSGNKSVSDESDTDDFVDEGTDDESDD